MCRWFRIRLFQHVATLYGLLKRESETKQIKGLVRIVVSVHCALPCPKDSLLQFVATGNSLLMKPKQEISVAPLNNEINSKYYWT